MVSKISESFASPDACHTSNWTDHRSILLQFNSSHTASVDRMALQKQRVPGMKTQWIAIHSRRPDWLLSFEGRPLRVELEMSMAATNASATAPPR
ncbi:MAG: hypothetical protein ACI91J_003173 [Yoonia sp.]|jgi:hypothetical protein